MRYVPLALSWSSSNAHYGAMWIFPEAVVCAFGMQSLLAGKQMRIFAIAAVAVVGFVLAGTYFSLANNRPELAMKYWTSYFSEGLHTRTAIKKYLLQADDNYLVFVSYGKGHTFLKEWVYNSPEIDVQKIIWAHDLGDERNARLMNFYPERKVWRVHVGLEETMLERWNEADEKFEFIREFDLP